MLRALPSIATTGTPLSSGPRSPKASSLLCPGTVIKENKMSKGIGFFLFLKKKLTSAPRKTREIVIAD